MGLLDSILGTGAAGASGKNALKAAAILGAVELIRRNGGLHGLADKLRSGGLGNAVNSWISHGPNQAVAPGQLESALGPGVLQDLAARLGLSPQQASEHLAEVLPQVVDHATPDGEIPPGGELPPDLERELSGLTHERT